MFEAITYELRDHVAWLTLNRPQVLNARNQQMRRECLQVCDMVARDPNARVLVLTGEGKAFSAGLDLKEAAGRSEIGLMEQRLEKDLLPSDIDALAHLPIPTMAIVNGYAFGGGTEMALACDFRIASERAEFGLTEVKRGRIPGGGGTQRLTRLVGPSRALYMILRGQTIKAREALDLGLVMEVVAPEELLPRAETLAREIAQQAPLALRGAKEAVVRGLGMSMADGLRLERDLALFLQTTQDCQEGARAFAEKRAPQWQGR